MRADGIDWLVTEGKDPRLKRVLFKDGRPAASWIPPIRRPADETMWWRCDTLCDLLLADIIAPASVEVKGRLDPNALQRGGDRVGLRIRLDPQGRILEGECLLDYPALAAGFAAAYPQFPGMTACRLAFEAERSEGWLSRLAAPWGEAMRQDMLDARISLLGRHHPLQIKALSVASERTRRRGARR